MTHRGHDPERGEIHRGAGARGMVVHHAAGGVRRAGGPGLHPGRRRARRRPQSADPGATMTDVRTDPRRRTVLPSESARARARRGRPLPKLADPEAPLLVVDDLIAHFSLESGTVKAVDGVSFVLRDGEALGIAGESGCGKTTTALSLVRLLPGNAKLASGSVKLFRDRSRAEERECPSPVSLARDLHRVPGRDERAEPGPTHRRTDQRTDRPTARRVPERCRPTGRRVARARRHPAQTCAAPTRTNCPVACASAR